MLESRKTNFPGALVEIRNLKMRGGCANLETFAMLSSNPSASDYRLV